MSLVFRHDDVNKVRPLDHPLLNKNPLLRFVVGAWLQHCAGVESLLLVPGHQVLFTASRDSTIKR